jgi:hypothetical protein
MPIQYQIENSPEYLLVTTSGTNVDFDEVMSYTQAIVMSAMKYNSKCLLFDGRQLHYTLSLEYIHKIAEYVSFYSSGRIKVALVFDNKHLEYGEFYEAVALNHGLTMRVTDDYKGALEWCKES